MWHSLLWSSCTFKLKPWCLQSHIHCVLYLFNYLMMLHQTGTDASLSGVPFRCNGESETDDQEGEMQCVRTDNSAVFKHVPIYPLDNLCVHVLVSVISISFTVAPQAWTSLTCQPLPNENVEHYCTGIQVVNFISVGDNF